MQVGSRWIADTTLTKMAHLAKMKSWAQMFTASTLKMLRRAAREHPCLYLGRSGSWVLLLKLSVDVDSALKSEIDDFRDLQVGVNVAP